MHRFTNRQGMTLIELMIVVGIIALLAGIMAFFVTGRRASTAQVDLNNELAGLLQAQRMRATSMNVATYIQIDSDSIEPRIGGNSVCTAADSEQYPIRYSADSDNVAIDLTKTKGKRRTLDSTNSSKYIDGSGALTAVTADLYNVTGSGKDKKETVVGSGHSIVICFQPNGQAYFMTKGSSISFEDSATLAKILICASSNSAGGFELSVTSLGLIRSSSSAALCQDQNKTQG